MKTETEDKTKFEEPHGARFLFTMNKVMSNIYGGTVDPVVKAQRRAKNKVARQSRRKNRR